MLTDQIEKIITKYLTNQASSFELEALELWLLEKENEQLFIDFIKTNYLIDFSLKKFDTEISSKKMLAYINKEKRSVRLKKITIYLKYAAVFAGVLIGIYFYKNNNTIIKEQHVEAGIQIGRDKATLTLVDGTIVSLDKEDSFNGKNAKSNGESLVYSKNNKKEDIAKIEYNFLTIPRGGQYFLKLSDGTKVWLNSESQLKYPVRFKTGKPRVVELVYGEAFFDVSPSTKHKGSPFKVLNKEQEIKVLGTVFNVKAYKDESNVYTTLVEGKVLVAFNDNERYLSPNDQLNLNIKTKTTTLKKVDTYNAISWKDGVFSFDEKSLFEIMTVLSRWYNFKVVYKNEKIKEEKFIGALSKNQNIEDILKNIKSFGLVKEYSIKDKVITLE